MRNVKSGQLEVKCGLYANHIARLWRQTGTGLVSGSLRGTDAVSARFAVERAEMM